MNNPTSSGLITSTDASSITAIPAQSGKVFRYVRLFHDGSSGAGQFSLDGGSNWIDFKAAPFAMDLPPGAYDQGVLVRRSSSTNLAGLQILLA